MEDNENLNNDINSSMFSSGGEDSGEMGSMFGDEPNQAASMFGAEPEQQEPNQASSMFDSEVKEEPVNSVEDKTEAPSMFDETPIKEEIQTPEANKEKIEEDIVSDSEAKKEPVQIIDEDEDDDEEEEPVDNAPTGVVTVRPVKFKKFEATEPIRTIKKNLDIMQDISLHISVELGRTKLSIKEVMDFEKGSIVELDKIAGEQVEVYVNGKLVAKGEVIVIEDRFGVRITSTNVTKTIA